MTTISYVGTGTLNFAEGINITPVIRALFSPFQMRWNYPGDRKRAAFAQEGHSEVSWGDVLSSVKKECAALGVAIDDHEDQDDLAEWIYALADHVGAKDPDFVLHNLLEHYMFDDPDSSRADLGVLFDIATVVDDGHGLTAIDLARSWTSSSPRVDELGGEMHYYGREFSSTGDTHSLRDQARLADDALRAARNDPAAADAAVAVLTKIISDSAQAILQGIADPMMRSQVAIGLPLVGSRLAASNVFVPGEPAPGNDVDEDSDEENGPTDSEYTVCVTDGKAVLWNPFPENFGSENEATAAAEQYLRDNPEEIRAVVDELIIRDNTILDSKTCTEITRESLGLEDAPGAVPR